MTGLTPAFGMRRFVKWQPLLRGMFVVVILLAGTCGAARAQVTLQILDRVAEPGQNPREGSPLPPGTRLAVLREPTDRAHTLENAGVSREELARRALEQLENPTDSIILSSEGRTVQQFSPTAQSGQIYYVLARTPEGRLFESYVNTGDGFVPGFDAVQSGRMTMGPVPDAVSERFAAVFRLAAPSQSGPDSTEAERATVSTTDSVTESGTGDRTSTDAQAGPTETEPTGEQQQVQNPATSAGGTGWLWPGLIGFVVGVLLGGAVVWVRNRMQLNEARDERDEFRRKLNERRGEDFRTVSEMSLSSVSDAEDASQSPDTDEVARLRAENEQLRDENEELQQLIERTKQYVREMRQQDSEQSSEP